MSAPELKTFIHTCYYGHFADHFGDQLLGEAVIHDRLGLDPLGNCGVKTGGATGGTTIWEAAKAVASGYSDCTLAMGWERMDEVPTDEGNNYISCAADKDWETAARAHLRRLLRRHGAEVLEGLRPRGGVVPPHAGRDRGEEPRLRLPQPVRARAA